MAQLALAGAGAVLGSAVGMPYLGFALGSMLGGVLFPQDGPPDQIQEGPRLHDLKVQSSAHGAMLPLVYGTVRIAGNVIWAADLEEQVVTQTTSASGGKGGGGSVTPALRAAISISPVLPWGCALARFNLWIGCGRTANLCTMPAAVCLIWLFTSETKRKAPMIASKVRWVSGSYPPIAAWRMLSSAV
jgi:hypothetical protein